MAHPPYMNSTGLIPKIFDKIADAQKPDRFTTDYLTNVLGYGSGSGRAVIPLLKRLNFLQADGTPTPLYARFRNRSERASAMLEALKAGYPELYARSEYAHLLPRDKLRDLIVEVTGLERENQVVRALVGTIEALKGVGGVNETTKVGVTASEEEGQSSVRSASVPSIPDLNLVSRRNGQDFGLNIAYTINLNLPNTTDPEVFNAIFKALKEHMLGG